jgi:REP element-mobilizing transposase RayT
MPPKHGGKRPGAGRPRKSDETVPHTARPVVDARTPAHITLRMRRGVWNLRSQRGFRQVARALERERELGVLRVVAFSVQGNHVHLVVEAGSTADLSRRMKGFGARFGKAMNRLMGRHGKVLAERYHAVPLRSPTQVKNALRYVLDNHAGHARRAGFAAQVRPGALDPFAGTSLVALARGSPPSPLASTPRSWVLRTGWGDTATRA